MAGRYRAILIGNSSYPADEHNLQTLKGPVKDIAALNRALADRDTGMFSDVDVTLLPEATSARAIRALGRFFGAAERDDVLLVFFSGHGKLDQNGRLHLCMQDTETTDLLSTAVSSARINEFADASRARNVVIVLDCCHAGAFRGGELGDAVAGPGRYVLTSCRGTQLANDATVDNGTSVFTQHLVDGLLADAPDHDGDGYVGFSDLYAYVDRRLRESGKQIPQRRVNGDGDLRLAKRPRALATSTTATESVMAARIGAVEEPPSVIEARAVPARQRDDGRRSGPISSAVRWVRAKRRRTVAVVAGIVLVVAGGVVAAVVKLQGSGGDVYGGGSSYEASAPWRLRIEDNRRGTDSGCDIRLTEVRSGAVVPLPEDLYGIHTFQIHQTGSLRWAMNDPGCLVAPLNGSGSAKLPFTAESGSDSNAFAAPSRVAVTVTEYNGNSSCNLRLFDASDGQPVDVAVAKSGADTVILEAGGRRSVYLGYGDCGVQISAAP